MPPSPQPNESREQATIRWLTQLLAALVSESADGMVRISRNSLSKNHDGLDLMESRGPDDEVLLRFERVKNVAVYPLQDGGGQWQTKSQPSSQTIISPISSPEREPLPSQLSFQQPPPTPGVTPPKSSEQIHQMEEQLKREKIANKILAGRWQQEQRKRESLEALLETAEVLGPNARKT